MEGQPEPAELPDGWERRESREYQGKVFYYHAATNSSQWHPPTTTATTTAAPPAQPLHGGEVSPPPAPDDVAKEREMREAAEARSRMGTELAALLEAEALQLRTQIEQVTGEKDLLLAAQTEAEAAHAAAEQAARAQADSLRDEIRRAGAEAQAARAALAEAAEAGGGEEAELRQNLLDVQAALDSAQKRVTTEIAARSAAEAKLREMSAELGIAGETAALLQSQLLEKSREVDEVRHRCEEHIAAASQDAAAKLDDAAKLLQQEQENLARERQEKEALAQELASARMSEQEPPSREQPKTDSLLLAEKDAEIARLQQQLAAGPSAEDFDTVEQRLAHEVRAQKRQHEELSKAQSQCDSLQADLAAKEVEVADLTQRLTPVKQQEAEEAAAEEGEENLVITFTEAGALGLRFTRENGTGPGTVLQGVNEGSQAATHEQAGSLKTGMRLLSVAGSSTRGMEYKQVLTAIRAAPRPLTLAFALANTVEATFTEPGPLGLRFSPSKQEGHRAERIAVIAVNPGTQAERHRQLAPGLLLLRVAGEDVVGKSYQEVLAELKTAGRPLTMTFEPGPSGAASPRPAPADQGFRVVVPRGQWHGAATLEKQREEEREVARSPSPPATPKVRQPERQAELDAKLEQLREELAQLAEKERESQTAHAKELSELAEKEQEAQAAHAKEVQSLQQQHEAELGEKERVHALEQAEAARLEERWQARVREAQSKQREYQIASPHEDEDVFVCYVCMNRVTVL